MALVEAPRCLRGIEHAETSSRASQQPIGRVHHWSSLLARLRSFVRSSGSMLGPSSIRVPSIGDLLVADRGCGSLPQENPLRHLYCPVVPDSEMLAREHVAGVTGSLATSTGSSVRYSMRTCSRTRRNTGAGAKHMVRYIFEMPKLQLPR